MQAQRVGGCAVRYAPTACSHPGTHTPPSPWRCSGGNGQDVTATSMLTRSERNERPRSPGSTAASVLLVCAIANVGLGGVAARQGRYWYRALIGTRAPGIIIHHSATGATAQGVPVDAASIDADHASRGWGVHYKGRTYHIGYHYVVLPDGTVQSGRPEQVPGAHTKGHNRYIGICLVGNFSSSANPLSTQWPTRPTPAQLDALVSLIDDIASRHGLGPGDVYRHRDFAETACPGDRFPMDEVRRRLQR